MTLHTLIAGVKRALRVASLDVIRYHPRSHPLARRMQLLTRAGIDLVLDVGANRGQYGSLLRDLGYRGQIVSFEPLSAAFAELSRVAADDGRWTALRLGLGDQPGRATLHVAGNSESSSILPMLSRHTQSAPESAYVGTEEIEIDTLAHVLEQHAPPQARVFVKLDTQGFERKILDGGGDLARVLGLQLEMSLVPLYDGETLLAEMVSYLNGRGFTLMSLEPGHGDPASGQLLQVDGVFFRTSAF
jgi:FkbM family methyltransferase